MSEVLEKVKSINVNSVFDKKTIKEHLNEVLFTVSGFAYGVIIHDGKFGESVGFKGDFVAVNKLTGEVFESNAAFLPAGLTREIQTELDRSENKEVKFTADIKAMPSTKTVQGYAWIADMPRTEAMVNRMEALKLAALSEVKKLSAPASNAEARRVASVKKAG